MLPQAFTGRRPFGELTTPVITSKIMDGSRPACPQGAQGLSLTDSVWDMTVRCWHQDPTQRPTMTGVVRLLRESHLSSLSIPPRKPLVPSLSIEADLSDFFRMYKTWAKDDQREKAQGFADMLDEVRRTERHNIRLLHHTSRFLTAQIFANENASSI